jgi:hypothetical protein
MRIPILVGVITVAAGACAVAPDPTHRSARPTAPRITVHVTNAHASDVRVALLTGTTRIRLSTVGSFESKTLRLPPAAVGGTGTVTLLVESWDRSSAQIVGPLDVRGGQDLELRIAHHLALSRLTPRS